MLVTTGLVVYGPDYWLVCFHTYEDVYLQLVTVGAQLEMVIISVVTTVEVVIATEVLEAVVVVGPDELVMTTLELVKYALVDNAELDGNPDEAMEEAGTVDDTDPVEEAETLVDVAGSYELLLSVVEELTAVIDKLEEAAVVAEELVVEESQKVR